MTSHDSTAPRFSRMARGKTLPPLVAHVLERMEAGEPLHIACGLWEVADGEARLSVLTWIDLHAPGLARVQSNGKARFIRLVLEEIPRYRTTAAFISGAIGGRMWAPPVKAGRLHQANVRQIINRFADSARATFRNVLESDLAAHGGDFQNARYSADTVLRVERQRVNGNGGYHVHVYERLLSTLPGCADYVDAEANAADFFKEEDE